MNIITLEDDSTELLKLGLYLEYWASYPGTKWGGGHSLSKWQVCAYSKSKVGAYQVKCVLSKIWGHSVNNPSKNQAIPYQVQ